jgi:hypothetical protein
MIHLMLVLKLHSVAVEICWEGSAEDPGGTSQWKNGKYWLLTTRLNIDL